MTTANIVTTVAKVRKEDWKALLRDELEYYEQLQLLFDRQQREPVVALTRLHKDPLTACRYIDAVAIRRPAERTLLQDIAPLLTYQRNVISQLQRIIKE